ncbi:MAG: phosphoribosylanthranilate isomerase [Halobacteriota archaeon]
MARVKICGITRVADLHVAANAGADAVGFITDVPVDTPREIAPSVAADLAAAAPPFVTTTLVLMPESPARAVELARVVKPDALQLHGTFEVDDLRFIRAETDAKLVLVVDYDDAARARTYDGVADAILVDSTTEEGAGGTGETHDWEATRDLARTLTSPLILAGGLTSDNVADAVEAVDPYAVDVASGVESTGGIKDHAAVEAFVSRARTSVHSEVCP